MSDVTRRIWAMKSLEDLIRRYGESTDPTEQKTIAQRIVTLSKEQNYVTPLTPLTLVNPSQPNDDPVRTGLPAYTRADTERNLLEEAIGKAVFTLSHDTIL